MNVAVVEPASTNSPVSGPREADLERARDVSEWIDPEGDDWYSAIYQYLTRDSVDGVSRVEPITDHWFG
jgi:hypothetical protein